MEIKNYSIINIFNNFHNITLLLIIFKTTESKNKEFFKGIYIYC